MSGIGTGSTEYSNLAHSGTIKFQNLWYKIKQSFQPVPFRGDLAEKCMVQKQRIRRVCPSCTFGQYLNRNHISAGSLYLSEQTLFSNQKHPETHKGKGQTSECCKQFYLSSSYFLRIHIFQISCIYPPDIVLKKYITFLTFRDTFSLFVLHPPVVLILRLICDIYVS